jgi:hypothetical protein
VNRESWMTKPGRSPQRRRENLRPTYTFLLRLEKSDVLCCELLDSISELANVAISLFFALLRIVGFGFHIESEESSLGSSAAADSFGMPILAGSAVAISLQTAGGHGLLFAWCGVRRLAAALLRPGLPGRAPMARQVGRAEPRPMKARASPRTPNLA